MTEHPGMPDPVLDSIQSGVWKTAYLRLALDTLQGEMPPGWNADGVRQALNTLRDKLEKEELSQIRDCGLREYLLIKPLRPDAAVALAEKAAEHVKALDNLGLIARIV